MTWLPQIKELRFPGKFFSLGFFQSFLPMFVVAPGPFNLPFLVRTGLARELLVVTGAAFMTLKWTKIVNNFSSKKLGVVKGATTAVALKPLLKEAGTSDASFLMTLPMGSKP